jgi:hypothetical protein
VGDTWLNLNLFWRVEMLICVWVQAILFPHYFLHKKGTGIVTKKEIVMTMGLFIGYWRNLFCHY